MLLSTPQLDSSFHPVHHICTKTIGGWEIVSEGEQEEGGLHMLALLPRTREYIQSPTKTTMPQKLKKRAAHLQNELISTSPSSSQRVQGKLGNTIVVHYSKKHKCACVCIFFIYYTIYAILSRRKAFDYSLFSQHYSESKTPKSDNELGNCYTSRHFKSKLSLLSNPWSMRAGHIQNLIPTRGP